MSTNLDLENGFVIENGFFESVIFIQKQNKNKSPHPHYNLPIVQWAKGEDPSPRSHVLGEAWSSHQEV